MGDTKHVLGHRADAVTETLTRAFAEDPVMMWMFSNAETRLASLRSFMAMCCERSISLGHAFELTDGDGAALWCPPDVKYFTEEMGIAMHGLLQADNPERTEMVLASLAPMADFHPETPHFYLADIGVDPESRGRGNGARLLKRVLQICDDEGLVAHLESSNPRNTSLYERAGFAISGEIELPGGPVLRPMTRNPS